MYVKNQSLTCRKEHFIVISNNIAQWFILNTVKFKMKGCSIRFDMQFNVEKPWQVNWLFNSYFYRVKQKKKKYNTKMNRKYEVIFFIDLIRMSNSYGSRRTEVHITRCIFISYWIKFSAFFFGLQNINTVSKTHFIVTMPLLWCLLTGSMSISSNYKCYRRNINTLND